MIGSMLLSLASAGVQTGFVAKTLGSNMVLQRDVSASIYGYSLVAGSTVSVVFNGETFETVSSAVVSNAGGFYWQVDLPPTAGGFTQYDIAISSSV